MRLLEEKYLPHGHLAPPGHQSHASLSRAGGISILTTLFSALLIQPALSYLCFPVTFYHPLYKTMHYQPLYGMLVLYPNDFSPKLWTSARWLEM